MSTHLVVCMYIHILLIWLHCDAITSIQTSAVSLQVLYLCVSLTRWLLVWPCRATLHLWKPAVVDIKKKRDPASSWTIPPLALVLFVRLLFFFFSIRIRPTPAYDPSRLVVRSAAWRCVHSKNLHCTSVESINRLFFVVVVFEHTVSDFSTKSVVYLMFINSLPHSWLVIYTLCPLTDCKDTFIWGKKNTPPRRLAKKKKIPHSTRLSAEETLTSIFVREK